MHLEYDLLYPHFFFDVKIFMYYFAYITERFIKNINFILLFSIKSEKITKKSLKKNYYYGIISVIILYYNNEKSRKENIMKGNLQLKNYKKALCTIVVSVFSLAINNSHIMNANAGGLDYDYAGYIPGVYYASGETGNTSVTAYGVMKLMLSPKEHGSIFQKSLMVLGDTL